MEFDPSSPQRQDRIVDGDRVHVDAVENTRMEEDKETGMERGMEEEEDEPPSGQLTSSRMGNVSGTESSPMFLSLLAEGSSIRCDSSMQVFD